MARKRLNKKVALIGLAVLMLLGVGAVVVLLKVSNFVFKNPEEYIKAGDRFLADAEVETDEEKKVELYGQVLENYREAYGCAKDDELKIEMLFKLADVYVIIGQWNGTKKCWSTIVKLDPDNIDARFSLLRYYYISANNLFTGLWPEIEEQAGEFIQIAQDNNLLDKSVEDIAPFPGDDSANGQKEAMKLGAYLHLLRGRATYEMADAGAVTDRDGALERSLKDLDEARALQPDNADVYYYQARTIISKGELAASRGSEETREQADQQADELLQEAVSVAPDVSEAHLNRLALKLAIMRKRGKGTREDVLTLEPEYSQIAERFPADAEVSSALAEYYSNPALGTGYIDKAIEVIDKARQLDSEDITYAIVATRVYYRDFAVNGNKQSLYKSIELAKYALTLPGAQESNGPRMLMNRSNRITLYRFLAYAYIEQVLEPCEETIAQNKQQWMDDAEQAVHQIEQLYGSGTDPQVIKWRGMLDLAKGNTSQAVRKMYSAYEQYEASTPDRQLAYMLAKVSKNTPEIGAVARFLRAAINSGITWNYPETFLDYAEVLLSAPLLKTVDGEPLPSPLALINYFDENFEPNARSISLRVQTNIKAGQLEDAERIVDQADVESAVAMKLRQMLFRAKIRDVQRRAALRKSQREFHQKLGGEAEPVNEELETLRAKELQGYQDNFARTVEDLLGVEPNSVTEGDVITVARNFRQQGKNDEAKALLERYLTHFPENTSVAIYKAALGEPDPNNISKERSLEIRIAVIENLADPVRSAFGLGILHRGNKENEKAVEQFRKVFDSTASGPGSIAKDPDQLKRFRRAAAENILDIAILTENWQLAGEITDAVKEEGMDDCEGNYFGAQLDFAREQYEDGLAKIDLCLKLRPIFARGYMVRSNINANLKNEDASIQDAQRAFELNPLDGPASKNLAFALYKRNQKLGTNVTSEQIIETNIAFLNARINNPNDLAFLSIYAEYIGTTDSMRALEIRQALQKSNPSMENAILLARLATRMAREETDAAKKDVYFQMAGAAFEQAMALDPLDETMLNEYGSYWRARGMPEKAVELFTAAKKDQLLWRHYVQAGQFDKAKEVLEHLHQADPQSATVIGGLLLVAERTFDRDGAKLYSEKLLGVDDNKESRLAQIQTFLALGLVKEAEEKLQSFNERFPTEPKALQLGAWLAMRQGQLEKALELANQNLEADQEDPVAWRLRGQIYQLLARFVEAVKDLEMSKSISNDPVTRIELAKAYISDRREAEAITELKSTITDPRAPKEARLLLERVYELAFRRSGVATDLVEFYRETLREFPSSVYWNAKAGATSINIQRYSDAEQLYKIAWDNCDKTDQSQIVGQVFNAYLRSLVLGEKFDLVLSEAGQYIDTHLASIAYGGMAEAKGKLGDRETAAQYIKKAVDKAGTDSNLASDMLKRMYMLLGSEQVKAYCEQRLKANPNELAANLTMYSLAKIKNEFNKAIGYIDKCIEIIGPDSPRRAEFIIFKVSLLQQAFNKTADNSYLDDAIVQYASLLEKTPNDINILNNMAYLLALNDKSERFDEQLKEAVKYAQRVYELRPNDPRFLDTYAFVRYKKGDYEDADKLIVASFQQFELEKAEIPWEVYEHKGMIKEKVGKQDEAREAYNMALQAGENELSDARKKQIQDAVRRLGN